MSSRFGSFCLGIGIYQSTKVLHAGIAKSYVLNQDVVTT